MRQRIIIGAITLSLFTAVCEKASATPELFDWGFNLDGTTFCNFGACDFDVATVGNITGPGDLPAFVDTSGFDFTTGLGSLTMSWDPGAPGSYSVDVYLDHQIDDLVNGFFNEHGATGGSPSGGQSWEIDEPFLFGDIFDNFSFSTLDGLNSLPSGLDDDVAMALGWDFSLAAGQTAALGFLVSETPAGSFFLSHTDPDSAETIYFSSTLEIIGVTPIPEPGSFFLLGTALAGLFVSRPKKSRR